MTSDASSPQERPLAYGEGRSALLEAAVRVVATSGLRRLTYRAVAKEAGVTHGLVTHHFGSRDALIQAALQYTLDKSIPAISDDPGSGRIESLFHSLAETVEADPDTQAFQFELILEARRQPELVPQVRHLYDSYKLSLRREIEHSGIHTDEALIDLLFATLDGLVFQQTTLGAPDATRKALVRFRSLIELLRDSQA